MNRLTNGAKGLILVLLIGLVIGGKWGYDKFVPKKAKEVTVTTKATSLPPLAYDRNANAPYRDLPVFNEPVEIASPVIRGHIMEWYSQLGMLYAIGGTQTSKGSIAEELGVNVSLDVQNNCTKQGEDLYAFAEELHNGNPNPTKGAHFIAWMGDGVPNYFSGLNERLKKDFGDEYIAQVITFGGASAGEDKWLIKKKYKDDARGSLNVTVIRDGDWNIIVMKSQLKGWEVNYDQTTYDPQKVNVVAAPNDDYLEAAKFYAAGQKVKLKLVKNGKVTSQDTLVAVTGVSTWFPGDLNAVTGKGGLVVIASTKDFGSQMPNAIIFIKKWAKDNKDAVEKFCAAVGLGGDQVKSHSEALQFAAKVGKDVFKSSASEEDIVKAYMSYDFIDDDGITVNIGGSRVFNLSDAATYAGIAGGKDTYKSVYNTFGQICVEAYPEVISSFPAYEESTDYSYLKAAYNKYKSKAGNVSKIDFTSVEKTNEVVGDASYSIEFATGSADIKPSSYPLLDKIYNQLNIADNLFVDIAGHTDNVGDPLANKRLSVERANSVLAYLVAKDSDLNIRLTAKGFGEEKPVADNATVDGKAKNRRVEIKLTRSK